MANRNLNKITSARPDPDVNRKLVLYKLNVKSSLKPGAKYVNHFESQDINAIMAESVKLTKQMPSYKQQVLKLTFLVQPTNLFSRESI
mgnify:CR=1 FL=1